MLDRLRFGGYCTALAKERSSFVLQDNVGMGKPIVSIKFTGIYVVGIVDWDLEKTKF